METPQLMTFQEKMDELTAAWEAFREAVMQELTPVLRGIVEWLIEFIEALQREWMYDKLAYILPDRSALWLSKKWPKKLLPPIKWVMRSARGD